MWRSGLLCVSSRTQDIGCCDLSLRVPRINRTQLNEQNSEETALYSRPLSLQTQSCTYMLRLLVSQNVSQNSNCEPITSGHTVGLRAALRPLGRTVLSSSTSSSRSDDPPASKSAGSTSSSSSYSSSSSSSSSSCTRLCLGRTLRGSTEPGRALPILASRVALPILFASRAMTCERTEAAVGATRLAGGRQRVARTSARSTPE